MSIDTLLVFCSCGLKEGVGVVASVYMPLFGVNEMGAL